MHFEQVDIAQKVYDALLDSADTVVVRSGLDGCWLNSHVACKIILDAGSQPRELILRPSSELSASGRSPTFSPDLPIGEGGSRHSSLSWHHHVAAIIPTQEEMVVIDPFLFEAPVGLSDFISIFPENAQRHIRPSADKTFAEDVYGKRTAADYLKIIALRHNFGIAHINLRNEAIDYPKTVSDGTRIGPTLGEFVRTHLLNRRHPVPERPVIFSHSNYGLAFQ
jgi:hypothetical protein